MINGTPRTASVPARRLLSDLLRDTLGYTGTHVGCEQGYCGACTVLLDGEPVRSCLLLAVTADGAAVTTVEGCGDGDGGLGPVQQAFQDQHAVQCGFCTPGLVTTITAYLRNHPDPSPAEARTAIGGNLCRCTGYQNIVAAVLRAAELTRAPGRDGHGGAGSSAGTFGQPLPRREDVRLLTGEGRYVDDVGHDALAAAFARSPYAHARIVDVDVTDALRVAGVTAVYTGRDLAGRVAESLPVLIPHPALRAPRTGRLLARGMVRHVGEAVAMVVACDRYIAEDAAERVRVRYEQLPAVVGLDAAQAAVHAVHEDVPDNIAAHLVQRVGEARAAIAGAPHRLRLDLDIERSASTPIEGRGVFARWDADDRSLRVYSSTQAPSSVRFAIAAMLDIPVDRVEVIAPDIGGGFGVKIMHPWPEEILVPWAARLLGRPVKWIEDRYEHFVSSAHERGQHHTVDVGFDSEGRLHGLDVVFAHDNGAYTPYGIIVPIVTSTQLLGPYKPGTYRVEFRSVYTNTVQVTPYRGAGRPQGAFVMERTLDAIARHLGLDRAVVRERNLIQPGEMPYDQGLMFQDGRPLVYDSGDYPATLAKLKALIGWDDFATAKAAATRQGRRIGVGLACYVEGTGVGPYEAGRVVVQTSGEVVVAVGISTQGQGHETVLAQVAASELDIPVEQVRVVTGDTRWTGYAVGTFASRAAVMSGNAVALAARKVRAKALRVAGDALELDAQDLEIVAGRIQAKGDPSTSIPLKTVAVLANPLRYAFDAESRTATQFAGCGDRDTPPVVEGDEPGLEATAYYSPQRSTFAHGAHAAIVEIDPDTAEITILRYCVVHDCGRMINPRIVEGQIHGGVAQGIAGSLYERIVYDALGNPQTTTFRDFLMPYATEIPVIETAHLETPSPLNPLGVKGVGEAGVIPVAAVLASAIEDAAEVIVNRMPLASSDLWTLQRQQ